MSTNLIDLTDAEIDAFCATLERVLHRLKQVSRTQPRVTSAPAPYVLLRLAATITGFTVKAMQQKIARGQWLDGREYRRGPDGHIYLSIKGYQLWVESAAGTNARRSTRSSAAVNLAT